MPIFIFGGIPASADMSYGSGIPSLAAAAQQAQANPQTAAAIAQKFPVQVQSIAMQFGVSTAVAAMMLLNQMQTGGPLRAMAQGGFPNAGEPVLVGERGPEVFVPDMPGAIVPMTVTHQSTAAPSLLSLQNDLGFGNISPPSWGELSPEQRARDLNPWTRGLPYMGEQPQLPVRLTAWDAWLESRPESKNVEDRRTPEQRALDDELLYQRNRNEPKALVQFPPAENWASTDDLPGMIVPGYVSRWGALSGDLGEPEKHKKRGPR